MRSAVIIKFKGSDIKLEHYDKAGVARDAFKSILRDGADLDRAELWTSDGGRVKRSKKFGQPETRELSGSRATAGAPAPAPEPVVESPAPAPEPEQTEPDTDTKPARKKAGRKSKN